MRQVSENPSNKFCICLESSFLHDNKIFGNTPPKINGEKEEGGIKISIVPQPRYQYFWLQDYRHKQFDASFFFVCNNLLVISTVVFEGAITNKYRIVNQKPLSRNRHLDPLCSLLINCPHENLEFFKKWGRIHSCWQMKLLIVLPAAWHNF